MQFEYRVGKLSDADYAQTKLALQKELAVVIAEIEKMQPKPSDDGKKESDEVRPDPTRLASLPLLAIDGVAINVTTGKPQSGVTINLVQPSQNGMVPLGNTTTDAQGVFKIDKQIPPGPGLIQATYEGTTYNQIITPGMPTTGIQVKVYDATKKAGVVQDAGAPDPAGTRHRQPAHQRNFRPRQRNRLNVQRSRQRFHPVLPAARDRRKSASRDHRPRRHAHHAPAAQDHNSRNL